MPSSVLSGKTVPVDRQGYVTMMVFMWLFRRGLQWVGIVWMLTMMPDGGGRPIQKVKVDESTALQ